MLAVLRRIESRRERDAVVREAMERVEVDDQEARLLQLIEIWVNNVGEQSARELLARLGWWLIENEKRRGISGGKSPIHQGHNE